MDRKALFLPPIRVFNPPDKMIPEQEYFMGSKKLLIHRYKIISPSLGASRKRSAEIALDKVYKWA